MSIEQKERAIPYSAPMVRARRAGIKTNTRRMLNPQPRADQIMPREWSKVMRHNPNAIYGDGLGWHALNEDGKDHEFRCPYGQPGDRLWTREAWKTLSWYDGTPPRDIPRDAPIWYLADGEAPEGYGRYRHGRFMMRWMSRGLDEITAIRVERLQEISPDDAIAEGLRGITKDGNLVKYGIPDKDGLPGTDDTGWPWHEWRISPVDAYQKLWESINGPGSWAQNPWVWVVSFKRLQ